MHVMSHLVNFGVFMRSRIGSTHGCGSARTSRPVLGHSSGQNTSANNICREVVQQEAADVMFDIQISNNFRGRERKEDASD